MEFDYEYFKREILKMTHIDLNCYKEKQMKRLTIYRKNSGRSNTQCFF